MEYVENNGEEKGENKLLKERLRREQQEAAIKQKMEEDARRQLADGQLPSAPEIEAPAVDQEHPVLQHQVPHQVQNLAQAEVGDLGQLAMTITAQITAGLQDTLAANSAAVTGLQRTTTDGFNKLNASVNSIGNRVTKCEKRINDLNDDQVKCMEIQLKTRETVGKHSATLARLNNESINHSSNISEIQQNLSDFSERMINLEDIIKQYQAGKLGTFNDEEAPNLKDHYDLKVQFNKSKHGIGYFPIFKDHIEATRTGQQCSLADAYCICVSEYLQMEMAFEERFVIQLERHVVEIIYNGVDTIFVIYDDIKLSGAKRVWQESHQLWARQTGNTATDPSLKKLEVPQFTLRMEALKDFANSLRWKWRKDNEQAWKDGARCRTRVLEAIDRFDYIVQMKTPEDDDFKKVDWPAGRELPRIDWKRKSYTQYSEIAMFPQSLSDIIRKDVKDNPPQGRKIPPTYTGSKQLNRWEDISVISLKPNHQYVPGLIDPSSDKTISQGAGLTDWIQMQQTGKDPEATRNIPKPSELNVSQPRPRSHSQGHLLHRASSYGAIPKTTGAVIGPNDLREPDMTDLEKRQKEEDEEYAKALKRLDEQSERRKEELKRREEEENRKIAEMEDKIRRAAERREKLDNMTPEERLKALEEAIKEREEEDRKKREQQEHWEAVAKLGTSFYPQTLIPKATVPEAPPGAVDQPTEGAAGADSAPPAEAGSGETAEMETDSEMANTEEQLDEEMRKMQEENALKEKKRWEEDEKLRLENEAKEKAKKEAEDKAKLDADNDVVVESEKEIEPEKTKQSQGGILGFLSKMTGMVTSTQIDTTDADLSNLGAVGGQPSNNSKDETILAGSKTPSTKKSLAKSQPSITSFLSKQSSTLTDSHFQDSETESEASEFMTPTGSPNATMRLRVSPEATPNRTLQATSLNETQPLEDFQDPNSTLPIGQPQNSIIQITPSTVSPATIREFNNKYHELVNITPGGMENRQAGRRFVTVRSRKDRGVTKLPRLTVKTKEDVKRSEGLRKRYPTPPKEKKNGNSLMGKQASLLPRKEPIAARTMPRQKEIGSSLRTSQRRMREQQQMTLQSQKRVREQLQMALQIRLMTPSRKT